MIFECTTIDKC